MLCPYALNSFAEQYNELKVYGDGFTPVENVLDTTTNFTLRTCHTWGCPVYLLDAIFQGNISGLPKW